MADADTVILWQKTYYSCILKSFTEVCFYYLSLVSVTQYDATWWATWWLKLTLILYYKQCNIFHIVTYPKHGVWTFKIKLILFIFDFMTACRQRGLRMMTNLTLHCLHPSLSWTVLKCSVQYYAASTLKYRCNAVIFIVGLFIYCTSWQSAPYITCSLPTCYTWQHKILNNTFVI